MSGFAKIKEQTFKQVQVNNQKIELALRFDKWTIEKLKGTLKAGNSREYVSRMGTKAELHWQLKQVNQNLETLLCEVENN